MVTRYSKEEIKALCEEANEKRLYGISFLNNFSLAQIQDEFNGVGAEFLGDEIRGWLSDVLKVFLAAAMIHDLRNAMSDGSRVKFWSANDEFRRNCNKLAKAKYGIFTRKRYRALLVAQVLYFFVSTEAFGWKAWIDAKNKREKNFKQ